MSEREPTVTMGEIVTVTFPDGRTFDAYVCGGQNYPDNPEWLDHKPDIQRRVTLTAEVALLNGASNGPRRWDDV